MQKFKFKKLSTTPVEELPYADVSFPTTKPDLAALGKQAKAAYREPEELQAEQQLRRENPIFAFNPTPYREPRWLTSSDVAKHLHVSIRRLAKLRATKEGPRFYQLKDGLVLYNVHDVDAWVMLHGNEEMEISL